MSATTGIEAAVAHHAAGRFAEAEPIYRALLAASPDDAHALRLLGTLRFQRGDPAEAEGVLRRAVALAPGDADAWAGLGLALRGLGRREEAVAAFARCLRLRPDHADATGNLGVTLRELGRLDEALATSRRARALRPHHPATLNNLGLALRASGDIAGAEAAWRRAIELDPTLVAAATNLADSLRGRDEPTEAATVLRRAVEAVPGSAAAWTALGVTLRRLGRPRDALFAARQARALDPGSVDAHFNEAIVLLLLGDYAHGWQGYEWRWRKPEAGSLARRFAQPRWDGGPLDGRTVLLHAEQGVGDTFQFVRYAPLAAARGGRVIVECQPEAAAVVATVTGVAAVVPKGGTLPHFDCHLPLMSLPRVFATTVATIPAAVPYLAVPPGRRSPLPERTPSGPLRVGLVWSGNPANPNDRQRSCPPGEIARLASIPGVSCYGLQVGPGAADLAACPGGRNVPILGTGFRDFGDTAAALAALDLLITVDTAPAHLAGALGRPVWTLLPFAPDFRWLTERDDSPWYSTMRLFRQSAPGDWRELIDRVAGALAALKDDVEARRVVDAPSLPGLP